LTGYVRFFMPALWVGADAAATGARARFIAAAATTTTLSPSAHTAAPLTASATKDSVNHKF
jgi:hypothetical protein